MGSIWSTPSGAAANNTTDSFSIDSTGNISQSRPKKTVTKEQEIQYQPTAQVNFQFPEDSNDSRPEPKPSPPPTKDEEATTSSTTSYFSQDNYITATAHELEKDDELEAEEMETRVGLMQSVSLRSLPKTLPKPREDQMSLREVDEIVTRMKIKYRPKPADLAGKSVFEEIEKNLVGCYKDNKDQPLQCAKLSREFKDFVQKQRDRVLSEAIRESQILS